MAESRQTQPPVTPPSGATAAEWSQKWFGVPTRLRRRTVSVSTTPTEILSNDPKRIFWAAANRSINDGAIGSNNELTFANGDLIAALGGRAESAVQEDGETTAWAVFAINNSADGNWIITDITRV